MAGRNPAREGAGRVFSRPGLLALACSAAACTSDGAGPRTPGPASQLAFTVQPASSAPGAPIVPTIQVTARDASGNAAPIFTGDVTVAIGINVAGGTLSGTTTRAAVAGVATFDGLSIDEIGGYTLTASATGLAPATSAAFTISAVSASLSTMTSATDTIGACLSSCDPGFGASTITVRVRNEAGTLMPGVEVKLTATPSDSNVFASPGATGFTNGNGTFSSYFSSGRAGTKTLAVVAGGVVLQQVGTVSVMPVLVGAGDITDCQRASDDATARLLDSIPGHVVALGDNAYPNGTASEYADCYGPTWGRHKGRTRPVPGNHDYNTPGASGYYGYFGNAANPSGSSGESRGYYGYDVGTWHIIALNSEIAAGAGSAQYQWLSDHLVGRENQCLLAYWHKPVFASRASDPVAEPLWRLLADARAEIVLGGHGHIYERFAPMNANGAADRRGIREFVVGTGGADLHEFTSNPANSEVRNNNTHGVLRLTLYARSYRWEFIPAPGYGTFTDSGSRNCN